MLVNDDSQGGKPERDLLTPELVDLLESDATAAVGAVLHPYVHHAVRSYVRRRQLGPDESEDLEGEAFIHIMTQVQTRFRAGRLRRLTPGLIYLMVQDVHCRQFRRTDARGASESLDALDDDALQQAETPWEQGHSGPLEAVETSELLQAALAALPRKDRDLLGLFTKIYFECEDELPDGDDPSRPEVIRRLRADAIRRLSAALGAHLTTVYRRIGAAGERLWDLLRALQ